MTGMFVGDVQGMPWQAKRRRALCCRNRVWVSAAQRVFSEQAGGVQVVLMGLALRVVLKLLRKVDQ